MKSSLNDLERYEGVTKMLDPEILAKLEQDDVLNIDYLKRGEFIKTLIDEGNEKLMSLMENPSAANIATRQAAFHASIKGLEILNAEATRTESALLYLTPQGPDRNNYIHQPDAVHALEQLQWATSEEKMRHYQHYIQMLRAKGTPYWVRQVIVNPTQEGEAIVDRYRQFAGLRSLAEIKAADAEIQARP
jgi:hypothetical protein